MPLTAVATILSSVKTATDIAKLIKNSTTSLEGAEIKLQFAELIGALADVKIEVADIQNLLIVKDAEIQKLKEEKKLAANTTYRDRCYWIINGEVEDGPFCQKCNDVDNKLVRLQDHQYNVPYTNQLKKVRKCTTCKISYAVEE